MYDWANSAYITTAAVGLLPDYFARAVVGEAGVDILGTNVSATALWSFMLGGAAFLVFLFAPVLGAVADFSSAKKRFLTSFAYMGSLFATLLFFCESGDVTLTIVLFVSTQVCFVGANVFYDAFLPQIASEDKLDSVSARGYAFGYIGGSLQFGTALGLIAMHETVGISLAMAARIGMAMTGIWWAGWTLLTMKYLKEEKTPYALPEKYQHQPKILAYLTIGISRTVATAKKVGRFKHLTLFLIAYMVYNDGIHTVTSMATIYGTEELKLINDFTHGNTPARPSRRNRGCLDLQSTRKPYWYQAICDVRLGAVEWCRHLRLLHPYRNRILCFGYGCRYSPRRDTGVESLLLWCDDSRRGKRRVLRILFCL